MKNLLITTALLALFTARAQQHDYACGPDEIAFYGNDLVSYYENEEPLKGKEAFSLGYDGLNLRFATKENLQKFKQNPDQYLPAYNGWCAIAIANGNLAQPDFNHYKIQDGDLLFFEVRAFFNGKTLWEKDPDINKIVADKKYKELNSSGK